MSFIPFAFHPRITAGISAAGYSSPTPIQLRTIPPILDGRDVLGLAQTGTGKTAAFVLPILQRLLNQPRRGLRVLIVSPTRELAAQIDEHLSQMAVHTPMSGAPVFGGVGMGPQEHAFRSGVDVIVATPGRLIDYFKQKVFSMRQVEMVVIDEADRMFDMGFIKDLRYILRQLPPFEKRQTMLFSATLSPRVMELAYEFMNLTERVSIAPEQVTVERVEPERLFSFRWHPDAIDPACVADIPHSLLRIGRHAA